MLTERSFHSIYNLSVGQTFLSVPVRQECLTYLKILEGCILSIVRRTTHTGPNDMLWLDPAC
jgi:hypothetical protein